MHTPLQTISTFSLPEIAHTSTFQMKVKIVLIKSSRKILYAEGQKDFSTSFGVFSLYLWEE